jgi:hypothetical protein
MDRPHFGTPRFLSRMPSADDRGKLYSAFLELYVVINCKHLFYLLLLLSLQAPLYAGATDLKTERPPFQSKCWGGGGWVFRSVWTTS